MFTVRDAVRNAGTEPVTLTPYGLISRTGTPHVAGYYILHEGLIGLVGNSLQEIKYSDTTALDPSKPPVDSSGGWLGSTSPGSGASTTRAIRSAPARSPPTPGLREMEPSGSGRCPRHPRRANSVCERWVRSSRSARTSGPADAR